MVDLCLSIPFATKKNSAVVFCKDHWLIDGWMDQSTDGRTDTSMRRGDTRPHMKTRTHTHTHHQFFVFSFGSVCGAFLYILRDVT